MKEISDNLCPYCGREMEHGSLLERTSGIVVNGAGLEWLAGGPTQTGQGEAVGKAEFLKGSRASGVRCKTCRKIILDY